MEISGEAGDDQGSGWLQVKKKHRSSLKFSLRSRDGEGSAKHPPAVLRVRSLANGKTGNSCGKDSIKPQGDFVVHSQSNEVEVATHYEPVVTQDTVATNAGASVSTHGCKIGENQELSHKDISEVFPKIKWGDLDDGDLGSETRIDVIVNDNSVCGKGESADCSVSSIPSSSGDHEIKTSVIASMDSNYIATKEVLLSPIEVSSDNLGAHDLKKDLVCSSMNNFSIVDTGNQSEEDELCKESGSGIRELPVIEQDMETAEISQDSEAVIDEKNAAEPIITASIEDIGGEKSDSITEGPTKVKISGTIGADDSGESKERFRQRLWCFLFENLNRAVDELYLLCELECDVDQMKEASLVLEEAASDFKDLSCRVEDFEKVKRSSSHLADGTPIPMKSDHRRPHALSWEVRRMTTSPQRAEILSSSLEAFRKIQHDRASMHVINEAGEKRNDFPTRPKTCKISDKSSGVSDAIITGKEKSSRVKSSIDSGRSNKINSSQNSRVLPQNQFSSSSSNTSKFSLKDSPVITLTGKIKKEALGSTSETENETSAERNPRRQLISERDKERIVGSNGTLWKSMDAWKEKRNWEDILASPYRTSSRFSHSPGMSSRKSAERARILRDKLLSPEKKKKTAVDLKKEAEEKHARATRARSEIETERVQKLQRTSEKLNRIYEWQAVRSMKLKEGMQTRHQMSENRKEAYLAQVSRRAGDESSKVNEVRFITSLNEENKKFILKQKLHDSKLRRAEKLQVMKIKLKEDMAREEAVLERKKLIEAEKSQRLAETQRKKEEAQVRREEERKASSAAREAKAMEQIRRKEVREKARQEESELLAQKLAERLSESEQRRKFYLEQIRDKASMDFRDQSSPLQRRSLNKDDLANSGSGISSVAVGNLTLQQSLKRRIKKIRQRLMALKYEFVEPLACAENFGIGYRAAVGTARAKIGRWLQELQRLRQARKEGAASIGLITAEMVKFLEGKDPELQASRQAGLIDFIASALPASHTSKPEACQVTIYLLRLLRVVLSFPTNQNYFLSQNLLPPIIPMLAAAAENYIKIAASSSIANGSSNLLSSQTSIENLKSISEVLDGFLWTVATIIGQTTSDDRQIQMQDGLLELVIAYQVIHRLRDLFALYDRPQVEGSPFPSSILLSINLLATLTSRFRVFSSVDCESFQVKVISSAAVPLPDNSGNTEGNDEIQDDPKDEIAGSSVLKKDEKNCADNGENKSGLKQPVDFLLSAISETGLVCLPSLLTAVLLQTNNRLSSEPASYVLPSNFEEVAIKVLKVLNNLALIDINFIQGMLARADLKMEFFHLMSFLLSHCTSKWGVASDQIGLLLFECLSLLGYFALFHPKNQAVLRWGKSPTILHKVCDLPFVFFSDPELMPVLAGSLVAACFGCEQNKGVIQQELSTDMLLSLLKSCKNASTATSDNNVSLTDEFSQVGPDTKRGGQSDITQRSSNRLNSRTTRVLSGKAGSRTIKMKSQKDSKPAKLCEDSNMRQQVSAFETLSNLMLHSRFPVSFINKAEQFFSEEIPHQVEFVT